MAIKAGGCVIMGVNDFRMKDVFVCKCIDSDTICFSAQYNSRRHVIKLTKIVLMRLMNNKHT